MGRFVRMNPLNLAANACQVPLLLSDEGKTHAIAVRLLKLVPYDVHAPTDELVKEATVAIQYVLATLAKGELEPVLGQYGDDREAARIAASVPLDEFASRELRIACALKLIEKLTVHVASEPRDLGYIPNEP
jgi:hypothetical protein